VKLLRWLLVAHIAITASAAQLFVDSSRAELIQAAPELTSLEFDPSQNTLDPLLRVTGQQLQSMLAGFRNLSMTEDAHELRFDSVHLRWSERRDQFQYLIRIHPLQESRPGQFMDMLSDLMPENQNQSRFRYLGRIREGGNGRFVVAFVTGDSARQGLAWIDEASKRVVRLRTDVLKHSEGQAFDSLTRDVRLVPVKFSFAEIPLWLPAWATVHVRFSAGELHSVHRFSNYVSDQDKGEAAGKVEMEDDPFEKLVKGVAALGAGKPEDALAPLLDAVGQLPHRIEPGYYLGLALHGTHDLADAEKQFRETIRRSPNLAVAHNDLGAVLLERGDKAGALAEVGEALRLDPENSKLRANLERVTPAADAGKVTIQVDVRQVLVPVAVTDKDGHHVTGLAQADFKVFEDGVEQKITGFASERADIATPGRAGQTGTPAAAAAPDKLLAKGRTYVICLDMLHASFSNFVYVREALRKLFREEQAGDSQYAVIALGRKMEVLQNTTSDPAKVLETFAEANFKKVYQPGDAQVDIAQYERDLQDARAACDAKSPTCLPLEKLLPSRARALAEQEKLKTAQFLAEFRSVVEQLARTNGRRTLILMSDGFSLMPAKTAFDLLEAYFPDLRSLESLEPMQDSIEPIFKLAVKANVPIYTIDSRGLYTSPTLDASRSVNLSVVTQVDRALNDIALDAGQTLSEIAAETGGKSFQNSNDLSIGLKKAFADGREYYMLAYVSSNETQDGKFRKIEVRVRDSKASVSAKRGYWATP